jgi:hypothetical protein
MHVVVSHDAGGAEILSSYVRQTNLTCVFVLEGPARRIFERKLGRLELCTLQEGVSKSDRVLCGTSWQSDLEYDAIEFGQSLGKKTAAFLDHWINYRARFMRSGTLRLPDEIWVGDSIAGGIAAKVFPERPIHLIENPYLKDIMRELGSMPKPAPNRTKGKRVLFVCEPLREQGRLQFGDERHWGYVEEEALRYFLANLSVLGGAIDGIVIRPHPSEPPDKYSWACKEFDLPVQNSAPRSLVEEINECDVVVGCETMAMVVGLLAGKRVISCIPPGGKPCGLPHPEIENLQMLLGEKLKNTH